MAYFIRIYYESEGICVVFTVFLKAADRNTCLTGESFNFFYVND
jgi:hypothetical protein